MNVFKDRKNLTIALLAIIILLQGITLAYLGYTIKRIAERPVHVSGGSSFHFPYETLDGYRSQYIKVDPASYDNGIVTCDVTFELTEKIPGSQVVLLYRFDSEDDWQQIMLRQTEPMVYATTMKADASSSMSYRMMQKLNGEIVRASQTFKTEFPSLIGSGDVSVYYTKYMNSQTIDFTFMHNSGVDALKVKEIRLKIDKKKPEEIVLDKSSGWKCTFVDEGFKSMEVIVTYQDGQVRSATYSFGFNSSPLITR